MTGALLPLLPAVPPAAALAHPCDGEAIKRGRLTLNLYFGPEEMKQPSVAHRVKQLPPIKALKGTGKFDVLEVWGHIYKADYRMRFIYAQIPDSCVLMGQEILEASDPY